MKTTSRWLRLRAVLATLRTNELRYTVLCTIIWRCKRKFFLPPARSEGVPNREWNISIFQQEMLGKRCWLPWKENRHGTVFILWWMMRCVRVCLCVMRLNECMRLNARTHRHVPLRPLNSNLATIWFECCKVDMQTILLSQCENATAPDAVDRDFDARHRINRLPVKRQC